MTKKPLKEWSEKVKGPKILKDESERSPRKSSSVDGKSGRSL